MATVAMILRSMARAPVGGPAGASGSGTATRAAYQSTAPRTRSRKTAVISAGTLTRSTGLGLRRRGCHVVERGDWTRNGLRRAGVDRDATLRVELDRKMVHWPWRWPLNDLTVAVVDRAVTRALEVALIGVGQITTIGWAGHGWILRRPW